MSTKKWAWQIISCVIGICFLLAAITILFHPSNLVNHTYFVSTLILFTASLIILSGKEKLHKCVISTIKSCKLEKFLIFLLSAMLLLMLSVKEIISYNMFENTISLCLFIVLLSFSIIIFICFLIQFFTIPFQYENEKKYNMRILNIVYLIEGFLFLAANFPFRPSADSLSVYNAILAENWKDWHTISYQIYVKLCMDLGSLFGHNHPFVACIIQAIIWYLITFRISYILRNLFDEKSEFIWRLMNIFMFIPLMYLGIMYKDVIFSMCLLAFCAEIMYFIAKKHISILNFICLLLSAIFTSLFRHGVIVPVIITLIGLGIYQLSKLKLKKSQNIRKFCLVVLIAVSVIGSHMGITNFGDNVLHMEDNPDYVKFTVPFFVCGNLASTHPELFTDEDIEILEELIEFDEWKKGYESDTYWGDTLTRKWGYIGDRISLVDNEYGFKIVKLNAKLLLRSPLSYLNAITRVTSIVWQIARPQDGYEWASKGYYRRSDLPDRDPALVTADYSVQVILSRLEQFLFDIPYLSFIFYRGGIWIFLLLVESSVLIIKKRQRYLFVLTTPLIIACMLMISCPAQDPRFVLPFMETGMLGFILAKCIPVRGGDLKYQSQSE